MRARVQANPVRGETFDFAQDRPFDFAQDRPFDFAQDRLVEHEIVLRQAQDERIGTDHGEPFDSPFVLRLSKDERRAQDMLVEPQAQGEG